MFTRSTNVISGFVILVTFFSKCISGPNGTTDDWRGPAFAGSESCKGCHAAIFSTYQHTSHYQSSESVSYQQLAGKIAGGRQRFQINDSTELSLEKYQDQIFQAVYVAGQKKTAQPF